MALTYWYEKGREFAFDVLTGLERAGAFRPERAIDEWFDFNHGSGHFESDEMIDLVRWAVAVPSARREFRKGYCDAMRETRTGRHLAERTKS